MSTNAFVAKKTEKGYRAIYVHADGYPEHMKEALKNYDSEEKVNELLDLGNISFLANTIEETYKYSHKYEAYNTPGYSHMIKAVESGKEDSKEYENLVDLVNDCYWGYIYIFEDGIWKIKVDDVLMKI